MQLSLKAFGLASGIVFAAAMFLSGLLALAAPVWGGEFMELVGTFYAGVDGATLRDVIVATLYALVDGLFGGVVFAWLYNRIARSGGEASAARV